MLLKSILFIFISFGDITYDIRKCSINMYNIQVIMYLSKYFPYTLGDHLRKLFMYKYLGDGEFPMANYPRDLIKLGTIIPMSQNSIRTIYGQFCVEIWSINVEIHLTSKQYSSILIIVRNQLTNDL